MNRLLRLYAALLLVGIFFSACSTEVELEGPWRDIPIVYGFVARQDTAHYLRVEKAFLPRDGDARTVAQLPDSLYYDELLVQLEKLPGGARFSLQRVDGNQEGYPREAGVFAAAPNFLYKIRAADIGLEGGERLRLILNRGEGLPEVTAETVVLQDLILRNTSPASPINMAYDRQVNIAWSAGAEAQLFDVRLVFHYLESLPGQPSELRPRRLEWVLDDALERQNDSERVSLAFPGEAFYIFLGQSLAADSRVIRVFEGIDLQVAAAGVELLELLQVSGAAQGITSFQSVPVYSNLSEGLGIFSSRAYSSRTGLTLNGPSLDSLRDGIHTQMLNFQ